MKSDNNLIFLTEGLPVNELDNAPAMTIERLRQFKGFEDFTDEQALNYIQSLTQFCQITIKGFLNSRNGDAA